MFVVEITDAKTLQSMRQRIEKRPDISEAYVKYNLKKMDTKLSQTTFIIILNLVKIEFLSKEFFQDLSKISFKKKFGVHAKVKLGVDAW